MNQGWSYWTDLEHGILQLSQKESVKILYTNIKDAHDLDYLKNQSFL